MENHFASTLPSIMAGVVPAGMVSTDAKAPEMMERGSHPTLSTSSVLLTSAPEISAGRGASSASFLKLFGKPLAIAVVMWKTCSRKLENETQNMTAKTIAKSVPAILQTPEMSPRYAPNAVPATSTSTKMRSTVHVHDVSNECSISTSFSGS